MSFRLLAQCLGMLIVSLSRGSHRYADSFESLVTSCSQIRAVYSCIIFFFSHCTCAPISHCSDALSCTYIVLPTCTDYVPSTKCDYSRSHNLNSSVMVSDPITATR